MIISYHFPFTDGIILDEEDDETVKLGLGDCLAFFTAAERPPPTGFGKPCTLNFNALNVYPTASTCALVLTLPTMYYDTYHIFRNKMLFAFRNYGGFGLC